MKNKELSNADPGLIKFSKTQRTIDSWTGGYGFYKLLFQIEIFGFRISFWKLPVDKHYEK